MKDNSKQKIIGILFIYVITALINKSYDPMQWEDIGKVIAAIIIFLIIID